METKSVASSEQGSCYITRSTLPLW